MSKYGVPLRRSAPLRLAVHPDSPSTEGWRAWVARQERPIAVDLFSGAGGLSLGLESAGYRVVLAADINPWALETHRHNFPGAAVQVDLGEPGVRAEFVRLLNGLDIALIAGGPPCQPYSRAGRSKIRSLVQAGVREPLDQRRGLWQAFLDVVERVRPRAVLMENVPDMALGDDMAVLRAMTGRLEAHGYEVDYNLVDTADHGVPQHRQRLILVGLRDGSAFSWPSPGEHVTLRDAIGDLPSIDSTAGEIGAPEMPYTTEPFSDFQRRARKQCTGSLADRLFDHVTRAVRPDDLQAFAQMNSQTRYSDLPKDLRRYRDDIFDDKYKRLGWSELSRSITAHIAKDGYWYIHPRDHRTLSVREAARIQTFPDHFRFAGTRSHQYTQIGNAVPPMLAEAIGAALLAAARETPIPPPTSARRNQIRAALDDWSEKDAQDRPWAYPPAELWPALVGLLLDVQGGWPRPDDLLARVPTAARATTARMTVLSVMADPRRQPIVDRLARIATALREGADSDAWRRVASLSPAQRSWINTLVLDPTAMTPSSATLRITARLTGTSVDQERRLSDGRVELSKLIGIGDGAARRNVALHRLGTSVCRIEAPKCGSCPLAAYCPATAASTGSLSPRLAPRRGRSPE